MRELKNNISMDIGKLLLKSRLCIKCRQKLKEYISQTTFPVDIDGYVLDPLCEPKVLMRGCRFCYNQIILTHNGIEKYRLGFIMANRKFEAGITDIEASKKNWNLNFNNDRIKEITKNQNYLCKKCGSCFPKHTSIFSGYEGSAQGKKIHCPSCGAIIAEHLT